MPCPGLSAHPLLTIQPCKHPISSVGWEAAGSVQQASWPWGSYGRKKLETTRFRLSTAPRASNTRALPPSLPASRRFLAATQILLSSPHTSQEFRMGCRRCRALPQHSLLQFLLLPRASCAEHGWKAIFLTNDFVGQ